MRPKLLSKKPRSRAKNGPAFVFVNTAHTPPTEIENQDARVIVRRQAARSGCRGRQSEGAKQAKIDQRTYSRKPRTTRKDVTVVQSIAEAENSTQMRSMTAYAPTPEPVPRPFYTGYERLRRVYNVDLMDLTSFTDVDLATNAYLLLREEPHRLTSLLQKRDSSFLTYLPSRYGSSTCLDDAMHCVTARVALMLGYPMQGPSPSFLYGKALKSLEIAIGRGKECLGSDAYCATRLMVLYELVGELYGDKSSMFEAQEWQSLFAGDFSFQLDTDSRLWWRFFGATSFLPSIVKEMRRLLKNIPHGRGYCARSLDILKRAKEMHKVLHDNHILYQRSAPYAPSLFNAPTSAESPDRVRLREFYFYPAIYVSRILATLFPSETERATYEEEAQSLANQALLIEETAAKLDPAMAWHFKQRNGLAHSIIQTRERWLFDKEHEMPWDELRIVLLQRWFEWENSWRAQVLLNVMVE
ncbi:hypothetical protein AK830_g7872 [Neonectria ditissima]|uniref:Uncharacterized protein n=1 Tax=Neonectria ditissima TaxID=78410 RepID=A0A0P7AVX3_9HYPO|nr:hypothetical protein AK830_g7872 [Neonectria ditissima]